MLTLMEHADVPISMVSKWAGYYDSAFTQKTYVHASHDDLRRSSAVLARDLQDRLEVARDQLRSRSQDDLSRGLFTALTCGFGGALGGTRTPNLLIRSQMLYPLSYERWMPG